MDNIKNFCICKNIYGALQPTKHDKGVHGAARIYGKSLILRQNTGNIIFSKKTLFQYPRSTRKREKSCWLFTRFSLQSVSRKSLFLILPYRRLALSGQPIGRRRKFWESLKLPIQKKPSSILEEAFLYTIDPFSCKKDCGKKEICVS